MFAKPRQIARPMSDAAKRISGRLSSGMVRHLSAYYASLSQKVRLISSDPGAELVYLPPRWTIDGVLGNWIEAARRGQFPLIRLLWNLMRRRSFAARAARNI